MLEIYEVKDVFYQILMECENMGSLSIQHNDSKDSNILIDENHRIKIIDFGSATMNSCEMYYWYEDFNGTELSAAPEVIRKDLYQSPQQRFSNQLFLESYFTHCFSKVARLSM